MQRAVLAKGGEVFGTTSRSCEGSNLEFRPQTPHRHADPIPILYPP